MTELAAMDARVLEGLVSLRRLLADPRRWTTGAGARDAQDREVHPTGLQACRWCLTGGVYKVAEGPGSGWAMEPQMLVALRHHLPVGWEQPGVRLAEFNDSSTHAEVVGVIDRTVRDLTNTKET